MKFTTILATFVVAVALITAGCGTSDSVKSITVSTSSSTSSGGFFNLPGEGATLQLVATANYNSGKTVDVTNQSVFTATPIGVDSNGNALPAPPNTVTINATGLMAAVTPFDCSWTDTTPPPATTATWFLTGSYTVIATYKGMASQPIYVGVGSAAGDGPGGACGPA